MFTNAKLIGDNIDYPTYSRQEPGIQRGSPQFNMSRGQLMDFLQCPLRWVNGYRDGGTASTEWGSLIDCLALTPEEYLKRYAIAPATYMVKMMECPKCKSQTTAAKCQKCKCDRIEVPVEKEWNNTASHCSEWKEEQEKAGKIVIKADEAKRAEDAIIALNADERIKEMIQCSKKQVMVTAEYECNGIVIPIRCLIDLAPDKGHPFGNCLADLKTSQGAGVEFWSKQVSQMNYHVQAALELDLYNAATGENRNEFRHVIQESYPPYQTGRRILTEEFIQMGRAKYTAALMLYAECLQTGEWHDYEKGAMMNGWSFCAPTSWDLQKSLEAGV